MSTDLEDIVLTKAQLAQVQSLHATLKSIADRQRYRRIDYFTPYPKQAEFLAMGAVKRQRMFNAGNRLGKSETGAFETACHLTGEYPSWWTGLRFNHPVVVWAAGLSAPVTRDITQAKLCGKPLVADALGTGFIPLESFAAPPTLGRGVTGAYDTVQVKHKSGGVSTCTFKSYEQGWQKFQGVAVDFIWLDEEPDDVKVYSECITRTLDTRGSVIITYTPLNGETDLWEAFKNPADTAKGLVSMSAMDVLSYPNSHIDATVLQEMTRSWMPHEVQVRLSGLPSAGAGAVFPIPREQITCAPIAEPGGTVVMGWGLDFGGMGGTTQKFSHHFGAVFGLYDRLTDIIYIRNALRLPGGMVLQHAAAMQAICSDAPVFWPHDGHRHAEKADEQTTTASLYKGTGLRMWHEHATFKHGGYATETGVLEMYQRFTTGRLQVCSDLQEWFAEFGSYSRDEKGELIKIKDDLMSATRILVMMLPRFGRQAALGNSITSPWNGGGPRSRSGPTMSRGMDHDPWNPDID